MSRLDASSPPENRSFQMSAPRSAGKLRRVTVSPGVMDTTTSARSPGESINRSTAAGAGSRPPSVPTRCMPRSSPSGPTRPKL